MLVRDKYRRFLRNLFSKLFLKIYLFLGTLFVLVPLSPLNSPYANRDSGVFLYIGWRILHGEIPYLDIWDHKPPVIFYINTLGLWISGGSRWGVWFIEFISLFITVYLGFVLIKKAFGLFSALISTFIWLYTLIFLIRGGNFTTEYTLLLQFASFYLFYLAMKSEKNNLHYFFIGILGGIAFLTKQTAIGVWIAVFLYLIIDGIREKQVFQNLKKDCIVFLGGFVVLLTIFGYFCLKGAFFELWDSAFTYNFYYSTSRDNSLLDWLWNLINLEKISNTGLIYFAFFGVAAFIYIVFSKQKHTRLNKSIFSLLLLSIIDLPLELLLINISGSTYDHYFMSILPVLTILSGFVIFLIESKVSPTDNVNDIKPIFFLTIISILILTGVIKYRDNRWGLQYRFNEQAIQYTIMNTDTNDSILVWGAETMVNFYSQRTSPSRYVYLYPLYTPGYTTDEMIITFLDDIIENEPKIIFDSMKEDYPIFAFPDTENDEIRLKLDYIKSRYLNTGEVNEWQVYELKVNK